MNGGIRGVFLWAVLCAAPAFSALADTTTVIHAGTLLAVPGEAPLSRQSVLVRDGRIVAVRPGFERPPEAQVIDLSDYFVLPGLIDLHVHLSSSPEPGGEADELQHSAADQALIGAQNARKLLSAGFTTVLDLGTGYRTHEEAVFALRNAIRAGRIAGPDVLAVGSPLSIPGQSRVGRYRESIERIAGPDNVCTGVDDCRRTVREQVKRGADVISFYNTGSLLSVPSVPITFTEEEMRAIVETAHSLGRPVVADGGNTRGDASGINAALRAGVDSVDTVTYPDAETWALLNSSGAYFVPHLYAVVAAVGDTPETLEEGTMGWLPRPILEFLWDLKQEVPSAIDGQRAGVRFAFGSDPGVFPHGLNAREFTELERAGLSPAEAIVTATTAAAAMLWRSELIGSVEPGKQADLIAVRGDPLEDLRSLEQVEWVIQRGRVVSTP